MTTPILRLQNVTRRYDSTIALDNVSLDIPTARVTAILGPSGCGKSTLLRLIAGLESPDSGTITWDGADLAPIPTHARRFGLMFQDYALFPHLDVTANIAFGLRYTDLTPEAAKTRVAELLDLVGLAGFGGREVDSLSGGEQQRVALARTLAPEPQLLMLDEPLGALDRALRDRLLVDLREILGRLALTTIYVTHDQAEAFAVAEHVVLMRRGGIEQEGAPGEIYREPVSVFAARFLGLDNIVGGAIEDGRLETALGALPVETLSRPGTKTASQSGKVEVLIRPEVENGDPTGPGLTVRGTVRSIRFAGAIQVVSLDTAGGPLRFEFPGGTEIPAPGAEMQVFVPARSIRIFP